MTFREIYAAFTLLILVLVFGAYGAWLAAGPHTSSESLGVVTGGVIVTAIVSILVAIPVGAVCAMRGMRDAADERDRQIAARGMRNAYWVMLCLIWLVPIVALTRSPLLTANVVLLTLGVAEISNYASRLVYYRRGL